MVSPLAALCVLLIGFLLLVIRSKAEAGTPGPTDWSDWQTYRHQVSHPCTVIKPEDLTRARDNMARYEWARRYASQLQEEADAASATITPAYLEQMIEITTPGCVGPCPACRAKGLPWHPNGQWTWSSNAPEQMTCEVCKTVFPHPDFPESIVVQSKWDPRQKFGFVGGETFRCFGYHYARPSLSGIIRKYKVGHVTSQLHTLATAYAFTGDVTHARSARAIFLRFADVFPKYLVRAGYGYGEYADCDPHVASERIMDLPCDEIVYPPNKPDRKIWTGYWSASRIGSSGMDGGWVCRVAEAYDLTCDARDDAGPVYSDEERVRIERDVLLEGAYLALCDPAINNKSVGNRTGAALVGLCVGHPGLVRFGLEGFVRTVEEWFLPDGGTSESAAYALMTMGGIRNFGLAFRDYTDPEGYVDPDGNRLNGFNACRDTRYGDCWQGLIWTLQGNLRHAPLADSYSRTGIGSHFAELIALAYPTDEHLALLQELAGNVPERGVGDAILYREPGLSERSVPRLGLPDVVFPFLSQGYLRRGDGGRQGAAVLDASDWGGHHHYDSLNLYYWQDGHELLSDLGYLWDHPDKPKTARAFAHNLVTIDGENQQNRGRGGSFHLFTLTPRVKVMEASSSAYPEAGIYRRTCIQVDHGEAGSYLVDIFRVGGGRVRDYVFHGPGQDYHVQGAELKPAATGWQLYAPKSEPSDYDPDLDNPQTAPGETPWCITWRVDDAYDFAAWSPGAPGEQIIVGKGWGQRDHRNTDRGAILPYILRRQEASEGTTTFVSVFAGGSRGQRLVRGVQSLTTKGTAGSDAVAIAVETADGVDIILSQLDQADAAVETVLGNLATDARAAVITTRNGQPADACLVGGTRLAMADLELSAPRAYYRGAVVNVASGNGESYFILDGDLPDGDALVGATLLVTGEDGIQRGYPIREVDKQPDGVRAYTKRNHVGFEARPASTWEFPSMATWRRQ